MQITPKALRLHIAILGEVNAGKSSFLNLMVGQEVSITSEIKGTTTDVIEKAQELHPLGPVLWLDTAGFADNTQLKEKRLEKTLSALEKTDVAVLVTKSVELSKEDERIILLLNEKNIPYIRVINSFESTDVHINSGAIEFNALDFSKRDELIQAFISELIKICPEDFLTPQTMLSDLVSPNGLVLFILPIDDEAPKGRLIMPQVQAIRDCLDAHQKVLCVQPEEYEQTLSLLKIKPDLVVCDSQVVSFMTEHTKDIACTTFSILMARMKGDLKTLVQGAKMIDKLQDGDRVLISESCTHHAIKDDIGTVKIPNLLRKYTKKDIITEHHSGCGLPSDLRSYKLIIQCGGCTQNRRAVLSKMALAKAQGVPITNYGICLSALNGVLKRVLSPFKDMI